MAVIDHPLNIDLLSIYYMEETTGATRVDSTDFDNDLSSTATVAQTTQSVQGVYAADFAVAGSNALSRADGSLSAGFPGKSGGSEAAMTVCGWFRVLSDDVGPARYLVNKSGAFNLYWILDFIVASIFVGVFPAIAFSDPGDIALGEWTFAAMRWRSSEKIVKLRINDTDANSSGAASFTHNAAAFVVGAETTTGTNDFPGQLDHWRVYNRYLSDDELLTLWGSPGIPEVMNPTSQDVKDMLAAQPALSLTFATDLFVSEMPDDPVVPDRCVAVHDTGGFAPEANYNYEKPTVQVQVRGARGGYRAAHQLMQAIRDEIHGDANVTWNGTRYIGIWAQGDILSLGYDEKQRPLLTLNYLLHRTPA